LVGPSVGLDVVEKRKFFTLPGIETQPFIPQSVPILTELSQLHRSYKLDII
jgi:hypothetical protein